MVALTAPTRIPDGTVPVRPLSGGLLDAATVVNATDPHVSGGFEYETPYCGPAKTAAADCGTIAGAVVSASVDNARTVTVTLGSHPSGTYTVDWGDGPAQVIVNPGATITHTYPAGPGTSYTIRISGPSGYSLYLPGVAVTTGAVSGPFTATSTSRLTKTAADGVGWAVGKPFGVYHLASCRTVGSIADAERRAVLSLSLGENRAVEQAFQALLDAAPPTAVTPASSHPVDVLAALEQYAAVNYGGVPVIHTSRDVALILAAQKAVNVVGTGLQSALGTPIAAGGGYTGTKMYATGAVLLERTAPEVIGPVVNKITNEYQVLVERLYAGSWECFVASATVSPSWVGTP